MPIDARGTLRVRRNEARAYPIRIRGISAAALAAAAPRMQWREAMDAPGPAAVDFGVVANAEALGLRIVEQPDAGGAPQALLIIQLDKLTASDGSKLLYGKLGEPQTMVFGLQWGGVTRLSGAVVIEPTPIDSDAAPNDRPLKSGSAGAGQLDAGMTLTIAGDEVIELVIDGAGELGGLVEASEAIVAAGQEDIDQRIAAGQTAIDESRDGAFLARAAAQSAADVTATLVGSINPADVLVLRGLAMPRASMFVTTAGKLRRVGRASWVKCVAGAARTYADDNGVITHVLMEGGGTIRGADWTAPPADAAALQYGAITGTSATIAQVGGHAKADFFGTTGKLLYALAGSNVATVRAPNLGVVVAVGDKVRVQGVIRCDARASAHSVRLQTVAASGAAPATFATLNFAADGTLSSSTASNGARLWADLFETTLAGEKFYSVAVDLPVIAAGTIVPSIRLDAGAGASVCLQIEKNPTNPVPDLAPVLADAVFAADGIWPGTTEALRADWLEDLYVGKTRAIGLLVPPRTVASPRLGRVKQIFIAASPQLAARDYVWSGPRMDLLWPNIAGADIDVFMAPDYFDVQLLLNLPASVKLRGAYDHPDLWPEWRYLRRYSNAQGAVPTLTLDRIHFHLRCARGSVQTEDVAVIEGVTSADSLGNCTVQGAAAPWAPQAAAGIERGTSLRNGVNYFGRPRLIAAAGANVVAGMWAVGNAYQGLNLLGAAGADVRYAFTGIAADRINSDCLNIGTSGAGTARLLIDLGHLGLGEVNAAGYDFWQSRHELLVDVGNGLVPLSASGLSAADLPRGRAFMFYGTLAADGTAAVIAPDARRELRVADFVGHSGRTDKPGYQAHVMSATVAAVDGKPAYEGDPGNDTAWLSDSTGAPSPASPRILWRLSYATWTSASQVVAATGPVIRNAGVHGDAIQVLENVQLGRLNCPRTVIWGRGHQGVWCKYETGTAAAEEVALAGLFLATFPNGIYIGRGGSGVKSVAGVMAALDTPERDSTGSAGWPRVYAGAGVNLDTSKLLVGTTSDNAAGKSGAGNISGPLPFAQARVSANTSVALPAADQPGALPIEAIFPPELIVAGRVRGDATPDTLRVTGYAMMASGVDINGVIAAVRDGSWALLRSARKRLLAGPPTHKATIAVTAAIGTELVLAAEPGTVGVLLTGSRIVKGDSRRLFRVDQGKVIVAAPLLASNNIALETDAGERVLVVVQ